MKELDLQTEIVTDSHGTIFANDTFQSVSTIFRAFFSPFFARGLLACIAAFICSNLSAYRTETAKKKLLSQCNLTSNLRLYLHSNEQQPVSTFQNVLLFFLQLEHQ